MHSVYRRLVEIDPTVTSTIHPNDRLRTIRAMEVYQLTGKPISQWHNEHRFQEQPFEVLKIGLNCERAELYDRINRRSVAMVEAGFLDEVRGLASRGYSLELKSLRSVGYAQMAKVVRGCLTIDAALEEMKQETRHLAKRQLTWFRGDKEIRWFHPKQAPEIFTAVKAFFSNRQNSGGMDEASSKRAFDLCRDLYHRRNVLALAPTPSSTGKRWRMKRCRFSAATFKSTRPILPAMK